MLVIPYRRFGTTYRSPLQDVTTIRCVISPKSSDLIYFEAEAWYHSLYVWWEVELIELAVTKFYSSFHFFMLLRPIYLSQRPVFEQPVRVLPLELSLL